MLNKSTQDFYKKYIESNSDYTELNLIPLEDIKPVQYKKKYSTKYGVVLISASNIKNGVVPSIRSALNKTEYFLSIVKEKNPIILENIEVEGQYTGSAKHIICSDIYGKVSLSPKSILSKSKPNINNALDKKQYLKNKILKLNPILLENLELIGLSENNKKVLFNHKYGLVSIRLEKIFKVKNITIRSFVNKDEFIDNIIKDKQLVNIKNSVLLSKYKNYDKPLYFLNKYGVFRVLLNTLLKDNQFNIDSYINKRIYFIKKGKEIHKNKYDYTLVEKIDSSKDVVKIICPKHGIFKKQVARHITDKNKGCNKCGMENLKGSYGSKKLLKRNKEYYKKNIAILYVLKIQNKDTKEEFFKVGVTKKSIKKRFSSLSKYYKLTLIKKIKGTLYELIKKEQKVIKDLKDYKYIPELKFPGYTECFSINPLEIISKNG